MDWLICHQAGSFKEFFFPVLENDIAALLASDRGGTRNLHRLDRCRMILQNWIHELIDHSSTFIPEIQNIINGFFCLPYGPVSGRYMKRLHYQIHNSLSNTLLVNLCFVF